MSSQVAFVSHYPIGENSLQEVHQELVASAFREMYRAAWFEIDYLSEHEHPNREKKVYKIFPESTAPVNRK